MQNTFSPPPEVPIILTVPTWFKPKFRVSSETRGKFLTEPLQNQRQVIYFPATMTQCKQSHSKKEEKRNSKEGLNQHKNETHQGKH
jgi:hypothetical protein